MRIEVVTLFPALIEAGLAAGVLGRAIATGRLEVGLEDPRSHTQDAHRTVDDRPFGGGPGMVLKAEPLALALRAAAERLPAGAPMIGLSAQGRPFSQEVARRFATLPGFGLVAGRYEGIDQRVTDALIDEELSIGDYVLSGGEFPALIVIDAVARLLPACSATMRRPPRIRSATDCSTGRITRGPKCGTESRCRPCCSAGTTPRSGAGG